MEGNARQVVFVSKRIGVNREGQRGCRLQARVPTEKERVSTSFRIKASARLRQEVRNRRKPVRSLER